MTAPPFGRRGSERRKEGENRPPKTLRFKITVTAAVVVVLTAAGCASWYGWQKHLQDEHTCQNSGPTYVERAPDRECVGVTDGSFNFAPQLGDIENKIKKENDAVLQESGGNYRTVAFLLPIDKKDGGLETTQNTLEQLEGAYAAQLSANKVGVQGKISPKIRLLIASSGTEADWHSIADPILERDVVTQRLAAVAGISLSLDNTNAEVGDLARHGIPVIGSTITGDNFDNVNNLVRVAPSNGDAVRAGLKYIKQKFNRFMFVEDMNRSDKFTMTLNNDFESGFKDLGVSLATRTFDSTGEKSINDPVGQQVQTNLSQAVDAICGLPGTAPVAVPFGGRGRELDVLIEALASRTCSDTPVTIVTGDAVTNMSTQNLQNYLGKKIQVIYMGEASGDEWSGKVPSSQYPGFGSNLNSQKKGFALFKQASQMANIPMSYAADGNGMMGYDASLAAIFAIRLASIKPSAPPGPQILRDVVSELDVIQGPYALYGASGEIQFNYPVGPDKSNPVGKVVPVLQENANGKPTLLALEPGQ